MTLKNLFTPKKWRLYHEKKLGRKWKVSLFYKNNEEIIKHFLKLPACHNAHYLVKFAVLKVKCVQLYIL